MLLLHLEGLHVLPECGKVSFHLVDGGFLVRHGGLELNNLSILLSELRGSRVSLQDLRS